MCCLLTESQNPSWKNVSAVCNITTENRTITQKEQGPHEIFIRVEIGKQQPLSQVTTALLQSEKACNRSWHILLAIVFILMAPQPKNSGGSSSPMANRQSRNHSGQSTLPPSPSNTWVHFWPKIRTNGKHEECSFWMTPVSYYHCWSRANSAEKRK